MDHLNVPVLVLVLTFNVRSTGGSPTGKASPKGPYHPLAGVYDPPVEYDPLSVDDPYMGPLLDSQYNPGDSSQAKTKYTFDARCKYVGQYLAIPGDRCSYLVCDYGMGFYDAREPRPRLYTVKMACAPGTFVNPKHGRLNLGISPCSRQEHSQCPGKGTAYKGKAEEPIMRGNQPSKSNHILRNMIFNEEAQLSAPKYDSRQMSAKAQPQRSMAFKKRLRDSSDRKRQSKPSIVYRNKKQSEPAPKQSQLSLRHKVERFRSSAADKKVAEIKRVISVLGMVLNDELQSIKQTEQAHKMGYGDQIGDIEKYWEGLQRKIKSMRRGYKDLRIKTRELKVVAGKMLQVIDDLMEMRGKVMKKKMDPVVPSKKG